MLQSVHPHDDLYPVEGSEDWTTEIQHPKSISLRDKIQLVLAQREGFEYEIPSHTAKELLALTQNRSRMEFRFPEGFTFVVDEQYMEKFADYHKRFTQQVIAEQQHVPSKL